MVRFHTLATQPAAMAVERDFVAWVRLVALLAFAALAAPFFAGRVYTADDLGEYHLPVRAFYADQLARGESFDWMPSLYCGFYLTGEGQLGGYHPWHWLLYRSLPLGAAFNLELLLTYPFMFAGMYLFLRRLLDRRDAALLGALVFALSGFNQLHFVHLNAVAVVAHIPWLLWAIETAVVAPHRLRAAWAELALALLTGSQILLGYPQYVWFSLLAEVAYVLWRRKSLQPPAACLLRIGVFKGLGILLGGVQLLATIDALAGSTRQAADAGFANTGSLDPINLVQLIAPYLFATRVAGQNTHELGLYAGAVPLLLCAWLLGNRARWGELRSLARATMCFAVLAFLLAMGPGGGLYQLQHLLPLVNHFRFPCRAIVLIHLAMATLAAIALVQMRRSQNLRDNFAWKKVAYVWVAVVASIVLAAVGPMVWQPFVAKPGLVWCGPLLMAAAAVLITMAVRGARWAPAALVALAALDQGVYGASYAIYPHAESLNAFVSATSLPPVTTTVRVAADSRGPNDEGPRAGNRILLSGLERIDGYAGLEPEKRLDYRQPAALRLAGAAWVRRPMESDDDEPNDDGRQWQKVPLPLARARLVTCTASERADNLDEVPLESTALVAQTLELPQGMPGSVETFIDRPGLMELNTQTESRQLLVLNESYHPGWQARVDGRPLPTMRVNGDFLGCTVEPGSHRVRFEFRPASLLWGKGLSACGLGLLVGGFWFRYGSCRRFGAAVERPSARE